MKTVKICDNSFTAELIRGRLIDEGIEARVVNPNLSTVIPYAYAVPGLDAQVVVADRDYERAMGVLRQITQKQTVCPECGSSDVSFSLWKGHDWKRNIATAFVLLLCAFSINPPGKIKGRMYCKNCGCEFRA